jgi:hypothetical protein
MKPRLSIATRVKIMAFNVLVLLGVVVDKDSCDRIAMAQVFRIIIAAIIVFPAIAAATTIAVVRVGDRVAMASDSLVISDSTRIYQCKVVEVGRCFFAASGSFNPSTGFDLLGIGRKACESGDTFAERVAKFHSLVKAPMERFIEEARRERSGYYQHLVRDGVINVVFFGIENGHAVVIQTGYALDVKGDAIPFQNHSSDSDGEMFQLGQTEAIQRFYRTRMGPDWIKLPIEERAKMLVEIEVNDAPTLVGGKISVILTEPKIDRWVERGSCNENKPK